MLSKLWMRRGAAWGAIGMAVVGLLAVRLLVDLSPQVEEGFFFAEDDPQLEASREIASQYGSSPQIIVRAEDRVGDRRAYENRVEALADALYALEGIDGRYSIATEDPRRSPMFAQILLTPDSLATNILIMVDGTDPEVLLPRVEAVLADFDSPDFGVVMSGVPVIVELIRRNLFQDLVVFSLAAVLLFALLVGLVYRDGAIVLGTLVTCFVAVSVTLVIIQSAGIAIGLLTANLVTIVFVLTLSHVVFLTANWARATRTGTGAQNRQLALSEGVRDTLEGSFWSMTTTLLGFLSLLTASAKPLRELGMAGAVGALIAMAVAYTVYPAFLARWAKVRTASEVGGSTGSPRAGPSTVVVAGVIIAVLGLGTLRLDTDPGLLTYFASGDPLREGLEMIDRDGGSSTLDIVIRDQGGGRLDSPEVFAKMEVFQASLEADPAVGMVLSPATLIGHARTMPLARFFSLEILLDLASSPALGGAGLAYVSPERDQGHYFMRMHESTRAGSRDEVIERLSGSARDAGLEPVLVSGLYDLQAQLGHLIASSLRVGIGGLLLLFILFGFVVSRSAAVTAKMWICLAGIPLVVLGTFGHFGIAVDIITSPAANVALAMGVDSMIHLVVRVRRLEALRTEYPWAVALSQIRAPVLGATAIICAGFGIFVMSSFPPTRRFGLAVMLGTATAATMALVVLPRLAGIGGRGDADPA